MSRNDAPAITVDGLTKVYRVGGSRAYGYSTLREQITSAGTSALRRVRLRAATEPDDSNLLTALDDVTLSIRQGDAVGFIGKNGAGKSTLLKILSRITPPTRGWAEVRGRVGSLLEVGTGFHNELTGRENVYLNGAILGMSRREIDRRFDEIVAFAEVERFLDLPIKRYSSGMAVRLAFAVAAHLEPEILIVDEVLAVGDAAFQRKSVTRMGEVAAEGRTVLFVSHNMAIIQSLCRRGVVLQQGRVVADGPVQDAVSAYLRQLEGTMTTDLASRTDRTGHGYMLARSLTVHAPDEGPIVSGGPVLFTLELTAVLASTACELRVYNELGSPVCSFDSTAPSPEDRFEGVDPTLTCVVDSLPLVPGRYRVDVVVHGAGHRQDELDAAATFDVEEGLVGGRPVVRGAIGDVAVKHRWLGPRP
jgi:lipopolysaccharide transport system ATP-binding protein